jgi:type I restriction enzyme M protein
LNEAGEAFENSKVKGELKKAEKDTVEYELLKKVEKLFIDKSEISKAVKAEEKALKEAVQERILTLTDEEIDNLMY